MRKGLKKDVRATAKAGKTARKAVAKTRQLDKEFAKLKKEITKQRKQPKTNKKQLNEYNLFIRRQIKKGKTFSQAVGSHGNWSKR